MKRQRSPGRDVCWCPPGLLRQAHADYERVDREHREAQKAKRREVATQ